MADRAIVVGSGAGGSVAAMVLAEAGWDVTVFERGPNHFADLSVPAPASAFSADELKGPVRRFEYPDSIAEPRVYESRDGTTPEVTGFVNALPATVGGGTVHWDAKTPRFWDLDFAKRSTLGPLPGADVVDWPFSYDELAPFYDRVEALLGVQGDVAALPEWPTLRHAPRKKPLPMPFGPPQYSSVKLADAATSLGLHPFPLPAAINSVPYDGRPHCTNCGFCCEYGCSAQARGSALIPLRRAVLAGAEVRADCRVSRINLTGRAASSVTVIDADGRSGTRAADLVVLAGSSVESCRLALLSELPDPAELIGRYLMFHWHTAAFGFFRDECPHAERGRNLTHAIDDFAHPDFPGAREHARAEGIGYFRGGVVELGASPLGPIAEGLVYRRLLPLLSPERPFGRTFAQLMRDSPLRRRLLGVQMHGEDVALHGNRVSLDSDLRDWLGIPVPRIVHAPHRHEVAAQRFYLPRLAAILREAGADHVAASPETRSADFPSTGDAVPRNFHTLGGMRMGTDPRTSVTDASGRMHQLDNVIVADGSVFPTSGGHNPTLTLMATALRNVEAHA